MRNDTREQQIQQIIERLAGLPGGRSVDVISKRLPRMRADQQACYESRRRSFAVKELPRSIAVPIDVEEVIIRLRGQLAEQHGHQTLAGEMSQFLQEMELLDKWDVRTHVTHGEVEADFELTLLTREAHPATTASDPTFWA
jgi:hypothetical protein